MQTVDDSTIALEERIRALSARIWAVVSEAVRQGAAMVLVTV